MTDEAEEEPFEMPVPGRPAPPPASVRILVEGPPEDCRVAILEDGALVEYIPSQHEDRATQVGDVYLARVQKLAPGVEAAFVDLGTQVDGFLPEVEWDRDALRPGEAVVVQVQKDAIGDKGARVTCRLALAGRYLVWLPGGDRARISRRIPDGPERIRLQTVGSALVEGASGAGGLILRTASVGRSQEELVGDVEALRLLHRQILAKAGASKAPVLLQREPGAAARVVRDHLTHEVEEVVAGSPELASEIRSAAFSAPDELLARIRVEEEPFRREGIEREVLRALGARVPLPSGGHLVIEPTEALVSIDVNSGGAKGGPDLEATALQTNLEATRVVARQLRLRDLGGILVVDFIDLGTDAARQQVQEALERCLLRDRANPRIHGWTELGLMIMSRRRRRMPLHRLLCRTCPTCRGSGRVDSPGRVAERAASSCLALLERTGVSRVKAVLAPEMIPRVRRELAHILERVELKGDRSLEPHAFKVEPLV